MLLSMTGFVTKTVPITINKETVTVTVSIKTLNSRFLEITCKMPHILTHIEHVLHKKFKEKLSRGSVLCSIHVSSLTPFSGAVHPSLRTIEAYLESIKTIQKKFGKTYNITDTLHIKDLISLPFVFETPEEPLNPVTKATLIALFDELIEEVLVERGREGAALKKDLENRIKTLKTVLKTLEAKSGVILKERRTKLQNETIELLKSASAESKEHHMQQLLAQIEKMDIHEELVRFKAHIKNLELCIKNSDLEKGKKIDFILQELFRETNTIAAKCMDAELSSLTIASKVELEKAREQAQNIV